MSKFRLEEVRKKFEVLKQDLPKQLANAGQRFFADSFKRAGFEDNSFVKWKEVNRRIPGTPEYKYPKKRGLARRTRAILVKSGRLRRSVSDSIKKVSFKETIFRTDVPYAQYHNDGEGKLPKRRFMGRSHILEKRFRKRIEQELDNIWK